MKYLYDWSEYQQFFTVKCKTSRTGLVLVVYGSRPVIKGHMARDPHVAQ